MPVKHLIKYLFIIILLGTSLLTLAQEASKDKIILKTGEVYIGDIIIRNQEIVTLKTVNGNRFQFPLAEIKTITKTEQFDIQTNNETLNSPTKIANKAVFGQIEI